MSFNHKVCSFESKDLFNFYAQQTDAPYHVLLHSGRHHPDTAQYSFIGLEPSALFFSKNNQAYYQDLKSNVLNKCTEDPIHFIKNELKKRSFSLPKPLNRLPFNGGMIGYFGYEALQWTEPITLKHKDGLAIPDLYFMFFDWGICIDHFENKAHFVSIKPFSPKAIELIKQMQLGKIVSPRTKAAVQAQKKQIHSNYTEKQFCEIVSQAKQYISAGDIFQVNLSQRFQTVCNANGFDLFAALNQINPSPFSAYFKTPDFEIISSSPERLIYSDGKIAQTRPIAGTRPKHRDKSTDENLEKELLANPKERAEHIMMVDLERNDLGKVVEFGSIDASKLLFIENYSHVRHLVSNISGRLKQGIDSLDLIQAMFPGGTITGTPKVRAMEIIDTLENVKRNAYTGSMGYFSYTGEMDFNILIRTFVKQGNQLYWHAGAGIVADSIPQKEYQETKDKAEALFQTLNREQPELLNV